MKKLQKEVKEFCKKNKLEASVEHRTLDLVSEVGEVSKEILKMSDYGRKEPEFRKEIKDELGDSLFAFIALANSLDVDLTAALHSVLKKYDKRLAKGGSAGSEND